MPRPIQDKPKNTLKALKRLVQYLGVYKPMILFVLLMAIVSTIFAIVGPKILGTAIDVLFSGVLAQIEGTGKIDYQRISQTLLILLTLYVISSIFTYLQGFFMSGVTAKVTYKLREDVYSKLHNIPLSYYDKHSQGDILSRITNDIDTITQTLNQSLTQIITSVVTLIGITVMMLTISWQLTIVTILSVPLSMLAVVFIMKKSQVHFKKQQKSLGDVNGHVEEMLANHMVVKAYNKEKRSIETFNEYSDTLYESAWKANFLSSLIMPVTMFVGNISYVIICILGGYYTVKGNMTVGGIQAFIQYVRTFNQPISQLASISNTLQLTGAATERVFEIIDEIGEVEDRKEAIDVAYNQVNASETKKYFDGTVSFNHVNFGYDESTMIINNFTTTIKPGQKVAIVGPTGAGKTTMIKLLMRFYDVTTGSIEIDGMDIRNIKRDQLRKLFGIVLQDTWLFNGTIMENIRYGNLTASDEEVIQAAKDAQVDHFVRTLPDGYDMVINEETSNVSLGQKQLLAIARAVLSDPKILILDEATSNVDTRTEILIQRAMDKLMEGRTSFVIAHRLSTIRNADVILVMDNGDIVEQGTHDELIAMNGFYTNLYNSQFEEAS
ncbi:ABC transporter ATP-binding protein [Phocicoccus pinnipedialis]|uniref:Putative ABC transporter ATP-binding protein n=1 Tax=Phocicoccus pinnipedialis TaxID=110845 RepID=A0A6V7RCR7_9BACL|nr:ABC transporter ATP-binding protein [Jeotgalicoccus pinnipedialis]MBP1939426.1 ATP-binding cassette subfamily B protein [Jeotgalicoccus pinnipedialis]CAD2075443.1 putative ABC transporter ATP-binding protein [Jeotgalicoccus pinnipedialis]